MGRARARAEGRSGVAAWGGEACVRGDECVGVGGVSSASCTRGQRACGRQHPAWGGGAWGCQRSRGGGGWPGGTPFAIAKPNASTCVHGARQILFPQQHWQWLVEFRALTHYHAGNGKIGVKTTNSTASCFLSRAAHFGTHPLALVDVLKKNKNARDEYLFVGGK